MATDNNQDQDQQLTLDDLDTPVDPKLLMGGGDAGAGQNDNGDGHDGGQDGKDDEASDLDALKKVAGDGSDADADGGAGGGDGAADGGQDAGAHKNDKGVPQERFNQVWAENKAMRERLEALERGNQGDAAGDGKGDAGDGGNKPIDLKALRKEATQALLDGDTERHEELQEQIDEEIQRRAEQRAEQRIEARSEAKAFNDTAAALTEKYPVLNPDTGDQEAIDLVVELRDAYIAKGMNRIDALKQAVEKIAPRFGQAAGNKVDKVDAGDGGDKGGDGDGGDDKGSGQNADQRKVTAIDRGAKDSNRIPPGGGGVGNRAMEVRESVSDIAQDKWDSMSQAERDQILANG